MPAEERFLALDDDRHRVLLVSDSPMSLKRRMREAREWLASDSGATGHYWNGFMFMTGDSGTSDCSCQFSFTDANTAFAFKIRWG